MNLLWPENQVMPMIAVDDSKVKRPEDALHVIIGKKPGTYLLYIAIPNVRKILGKYEMQDIFNLNGRKFAETLKNKALSFSMNLRKVEPDEAIVFEIGFENNQPKRFGIGFQKIYLKQTYSFSEFEKQMTKEAIALRFLAGQLSPLNEDKEMSASKMINLFMRYINTKYRKFGIDVRGLDNDILPISRPLRGGPLALLSNLLCFAHVADNGLLSRRAIACMKSCEPTLSG